MVSTAAANTGAAASKAAIKESLLTPRFYTTDFEKAANLDLTESEDDLKVMIAQMRADYNRHHFVRTDKFKQDWAHIQGKERAAFVDYLERSCVSEFSGFLLFKELSRRLKERQPLLAEVFALMARDEARHAGFLNKAMADFNITLDLSKMTKKRTYTFFPVEWIIYAVYLSEKIGYWRYILIHQHLAKHPENSFYPLFDYFEPWCQDENRHGDIFKVLLRSQSNMWNNWRARMWSRFFLLSVFATHSLTVHERTEFYTMLGLDAKQFDRDVICKTNDTAARAFPVVLNVDHPKFFQRLDRCAQRNLKIQSLEKNLTKKPPTTQSPASKLQVLTRKVWTQVRKLTLVAGTVADLLQIYFIKPLDAETLRDTVK
ncbi:MAG: magnesium-protoporphyrin IX monomethyl ester (oxidative) cyclase [Phormidesmis sp.]